MPSQTPLSSTGPRQATSSIFITVGPREPHHAWNGTFFTGMCWESPTRALASAVKLRTISLPHLEKPVDQFQTHPANLIDAVCLVTRNPGSWRMAELEGNVSEGSWRLGPPP